jgi:hypothetical protein
MTALDKVSADIFLGSVKSEYTCGYTLTQSAVMTMAPDNLCKDSNYEEDKILILKSIIGISKSLRINEEK